jgi:DNA replication protein DnaC
MGEVLHISQLLEQSLPQEQIISLQEVLNKKTTFTASEARQLGYKFESPEPLSEICQFCKKELPYKGLKHFVRNSIWMWLKPDMCECNEAQKYWKEQVRIVEEEQKRLSEEEKRKQLQKKVEKLFEKSKLGERFKTRTFDNYKVTDTNSMAYKTAKKYADNFEQYKCDGIGLMFSGSYGTGKTHLAASIAIELINKGNPVIFGTLINLLGKVKQAYDDNFAESEESILDLYKTVDLLIIDDLGKEKPSEWALEKLYSIMNQRYENYKPIIITTNYNTETLIDRLTVKGNSETAEAIVSRLHEMCRGVLLNGADFRKA